MTSAAFSATAAPASDPTDPRTSAPTVPLSHTGPIWRQKVRSEITLQELLASSWSEAAQDDRGKTTDEARDTEVRERLKLWLAPPAHEQLHAQRSVGRSSET